MIKISVLTKVSFFLMILIFLSCVQKPKEYAIIETEEGRIVLKFFPDVAPKHVESFKILAREGYFNGTSFHRIVPGFVIQGGDPNSKDGILIIQLRLIANADKELTTCAIFLRPSGHRKSAAPMWTIIEFGR